MSSIRWVLAGCVLTVFPSLVGAQSLRAAPYGSLEYQREMIDRMRESSERSAAQQEKKAVVNVGNAADPAAELAKVLLDRRADALGRGKKHHTRRASKHALTVANAFPSLFLAMPFDVGDVGQLGTTNVRQVLSANEVRVEVLSNVARASCDVIIRGLPTQGMIDNRARSFAGTYFRVAGSATYQTLAGSRTLPVLRPFDVSPAKRLFDEAVSRELEKKHLAAKPTVESSPEVHAKSLLSNARKLAKAGVFGAAEKKFRQVIKEAPGTSEAAEAQKELDALPPH